MQLDLGFVAEVASCRRDVDRNGLVHLTEHVELLVVAPRPLQLPVDSLGDGAGELGQTEPVGANVIALVAQRGADCLDDLADRVRASVGDPPRQARLGRGEFGEHDAVHQVVDVRHRTTLAAIAEHGKAPGSHQREECGLASRLVRSVEPWGAHHHGIEPPIDRFEHTEFGLHLRVAIAEVRVVRLVVAERVGP